MQKNQHTSTSYEASPNFHSWLSAIDQQPGLLWAWLSVSSLQRGTSWPTVQRSVASGYWAQERLEEGCCHNHWANADPAILTVVNVAKKRTSFAASPTDTARPQENDPRRDRWEHQNEDFVRDFHQLSPFLASTSTFPARLPSTFRTSRKKMPRLPRNLHLVAAWRSPASAICNKHATRHV